MTPNHITLARLILSPALVLMALAGQQAWFCGLFLVLLISDAVDGYLARHFQQTSTLGAKLDGWADLAMWMSALLGIWFLWPEIIKRELFFVLFALVCYLLPMIVGFIKYGKVPIYHCWSAKIQAVMMGIAVGLLLVLDMPWLFRIVAITQGLASMEDIAITLLLPQPQVDILSYWHARKKYKSDRRF